MLATPGHSTCSTCDASGPALKEAMHQRRLEDELPTTPPGDRPDPSLPTPGPEPAPVPEHLPGKDDEPDKSPTEPPKPMRVRTVTNRPPVEAVAAEQVREDFDRLAVVLLRLPPLRERGEGILALADPFSRGPDPSLRCRQVLLRGDAHQARAIRLAGQRAAAA